MTATGIVILHGGGPRSLVATALTLHQHPDARLSLLHVHDGRPNDPTRWTHVQRQAEHFKLTRLVELQAPFVRGARPGPADSTPPLATPRLLLTALGALARPAHQRLVWPIAVDADPDAAARATEQALLCEHLAVAEAHDAPALEMPLLEMSDAQLVELGTQLDVPWTLAWACLGRGTRPCRQCPACHRRARAFDRAGIVDPADKLALAS